MKGKRIVISLLSVLLVFSLMPTMAFAEPIPMEEEIAIDETNFPDEEFREYINQYDNDHNDILSYEERSSVTSIYLTDGEENSIKTVKGIEYFPNLLELECGFSQIKEIDLSHNTNLEYFGCGNSLVSNLDLSANVALKSLWCNNTEISSLNLSNNPNLQTLNCNDTFLTALDLSHNTELKELNCSSTPISSLNLNANTKLEKLNCSSTLITALDLKSNSELGELICSNMRLKDIDISANSKLKYLNCSETFVSSLNLSQNKELTDLLCSSTLLAALDLKENAKLELLYCNYTNISELDLSKNTQLEKLSLSYTPIAELDLSNNKKLKSFDCIKARFAWIDLSHNLQIFEGAVDSEITIETKASSLNLEEQFPGIDVTKISNVEGATLEGAVLTGYDSKTPVTYTYDCGLPSPTLSEMEVTLHIIGDNEETPPDIDDPGSGGGIIIPPTTQKPVIATDDHSSATLSADGTKVTIKIEEGYELVSVILNGKDLGKVTTISGLKTGDRVSVTTRKTPTDEEEIQQELKGVNWKNFLTRSAQVKMKNGKKAIRLTFINNHDVSFDGIEVFRSLKKNSGYGAEPIFTTTNDKYYNTAIKKGTRYYYKARGYIEYKGVRYYSGWSAKAWRMVK